MQATCFGLQLGHPQACKYKTLTKENTVKFVRGPFSFFYSHYYKNIQIVKIVTVKNLKRGPLKY